MRFPWAAVRVLTVASAVAAGYFWHGALEDPARVERIRARYARLRCGPRRCSTADRDSRPGLRAGDERAENGPTPDGASDCRASSDEPDRAASAPGAAPVESADDEPARVAQPGCARHQAAAPGSAEAQASGAEAHAARAEAHAASGSGSHAVAGAGFDSDSWVRRSPVSHTGPGARSCAGARTHAARDDTAARGRAAAGGKARLGKGDDNHVHTGPPGQEKEKDKQKP